MEYTYIGTEIKIAKEQIRCDAISSWEEWMIKEVPVGEKKELKHRDDIMKLFPNRKGIMPGAEYIERTFVDEDGQVFILNSLPTTDKVAIRNEFYHPVILNQIKNESTR